MHVYQLRCVFIISMILVFLFIIPDALTRPTDKQNHGYLRINGRLWQFDDGTPFIPIGISLGGIAFATKADAFEETWGMSPDAFFDTLAEHGVNFVAAHTHIAEWFNYPEFKSYDRTHAEENLDWFLNKLEENGQVTTISLTHHAEHIPGRLWPWNAYNAAQGGPCETHNDFVTHPEAIAKMKDKIDFYADFNAYRSFGVWQISTEWVLGNEDGNAPSFENAATANWHQEMAGYIRQQDDYFHPVSGNLNWMDYHDTVPEDAWWRWKASGTPAWHSLYGELYNHPNIDYVNIHTYNLDVGFAMQDFYHYNKPILITESVSDLFTESNQPSWIDDGIDFLRHQTWAAMALWTCAPDWSLWRVDNDGSSAMDQDMLEHFEDYCDVFAAASSFAHDVIIPDWPNWNKSPELWKNRISGTGKIYASGDGSRVMAYIRASCGDYTISGLKEGTYEVAIYDIITGEKIYSVQKQGKPMTVTTPGGHIMLYIKPAGNASAGSLKGRVQSFVLEQNYPNPFNPGTLIRFTIPEAAFVSLTVYDIKGQCVRTLNQRRFQAGHHVQEWDGRNAEGELVSNGVYICTLKTSDQMLTRRMVFLK